MKIINNKWVIGFALLIGGIFLGWLIKPSGVESTEQEHVHLEETYTCSMHPQVRSSTPGSCPICGMDLVPVSTNGDEETGPSEIQMTESAIKLASIQTMKVSSTTLEREISVQGKVKPDERKNASVAAHFSGRVEKLFIDYTGQFINKGQRMATLYSPDLVTAQKELFEAAKLKDSSPSYYESAVKKLKLWELTDGQIQNILKKGEPQFSFDVVAPRSGTVLGMHVSEGEYVKDGTILYELSDLTNIWIVFDAYENDLPWIHTGDSIRFSLPSNPGVEFKSVISFIEPVINTQTRTASVRVEMKNSNQIYKPEMFVEGSIISKPVNSADHLLIPKSAVLWTGKRAVVYVKQENYTNPTFQYREIVLGPDAGEFYSVSSGLQEGEEIAINGVFKIDAAAQLQGKQSMMNPDGGIKSTGHDHGDMKTPSENQPATNTEIVAVDADFKDQLTGLFNSYLPLKDQFIETNSKKASDAAVDFKKKLEQVDMKLLKGEIHMEWMVMLEVLEESTDEIINSEDVSIQRAAFSPLSDILYEALLKFNVTGIGAYRQFCPMAFDFKGAYWLSDSDEILNPYFGDEMLTCGNVDAEIK